MKPHWQKLQEWWAEDFIFWNKQKEFFIAIARKHPDNKAWHKIIEGLKGLIRIEQKRYRKIYGEKFDMNNLEKNILIRWINNSNYVFNSWERKFMSDIESQEYQLSPRQAERLNQIYKKSAGGGIY